MSTPIAEFKNLFATAKPGPFAVPAGKFTVECYQLYPGKVTLGRQAADGTFTPVLSFDKATSSTVETLTAGTYQVGLDGIADNVSFTLTPAA